MSYERHNAIIVTCPDYALQPDGIMAGSSLGMPAPDVPGFRASLPPEWQPLVVGPIPSVINNYVTYVFAPDGSQEGWRDSDDGDRYRAQFLAMFSFAWSDGSTPFDVLVVDARFGGDEPGAEYEPELIVESNIHRKVLRTAAGEVADHA